MAQISGVAKRYDGLPVDYVLVFDWVTGDRLGTSVPDNNGNWSHNYYFDLRCGITYVSDGCEPITHGAYFFEAKSAFKWWRIINITVRTSEFPVRSAAEIRFINAEGVNSNVPSKAFSESIFDTGYEAGRAFDGNPSTMAHSETFGTNNQKGYLYYIGYQFDTPVTVTSISVQMRQDMASNFGQEWQTAVIEASDDGVLWFKRGEIRPMIATMDLSVITSAVIKG